MNSEVAIDYLKAVDPVLATLIEKLDPYPIATSASNDSLLSALAKAIFYQSVSIQSANAVYSRFLQLYPDCAFPAAVDILNTPDQTLKAVGLPSSKISYLQGLARQEDALPTLDQLAELDDETVIRLLTQLRGIGRWSAQMVLIFQLRRLDILPVDDLGVRSAVRDLYGLGQLPDKATLEALGNQWQPYRTVASWYLWQSRGSAAQDLLRAWS